MRLRRLSECHRIGESEEFYVAASTNNDTNIKIRDGILDIKELVEMRGDLERWFPRARCEFPLTAAMLKGEVLPQLGILSPQWSRDKYALVQIGAGSGCRSAR
ncbi:hypothetical protein [Methylocystis sp.]|uniref:hypothetical protein n=1 Tax=Methylocystis sp. TaxID=1911079 RepID=UPI003D129E8A